MQPHSLEGIALTKTAKEKKKNGQDLEPAANKNDTRDLSKACKESWHRFNGRGVKRRLSENVSVAVTIPLLSLPQVLEKK